MADEERPHWMLGPRTSSAITGTGVILMALFPGAWLVGALVGTVGFIPLLSYGVARLRRRSTQPIPPTMTAAMIEPHADFHLTSALLARLGAPLDPAILSRNGNYQAACERCGIVWLKHFSRFYFLLPDGTWRHRNEPPGNPTDELYEAEHLHEKFGPPEGKLPPWAGVARIAQEEPDFWRDKVGWTVWEIGILTIPFQEFEQGYVIGPIVHAPSDDEPFGEVIVLLKDGSWETQRLAQSKPPTYSIKRKRR